MKIAVSCLIDNSPKLIIQGWNWLASLRAAGTTARADIFIHYTPQIYKETLDVFERLDAKLIKVEPFGKGPAVYCNKIRQVESDLFFDYDYTILSDADLLFLSCPTRLTTGNAVRAKMVDLPNPPEPIWHELLTRAGLADHIKRVPIELQPKNTTFSTNFNGGLYVLPKASIHSIRGKWSKWARYCLDQPSLLGKYLLHSDQLGFGMALLEGEREGLDNDSLPISENFPGHLSTDIYRKLVETKIHAIHYHSKLDSRGYLLSTGVEWIDKQIGAGNEILRHSRQQDFNSKAF
jgi:hypothetical protein